MYELILANILRHIQLNTNEINYFTSLIKSKKLRKRQYLLQEGDICKHEFFVTEGCLRAYYINNTGQEHIVQFAVEDWWIGDLYGFLTGNPTTLNIDAVEDSHVLYIDKASLEKLYEHIPSFNKYFRILLQNAFIAQQQRILYNLSTDATQRYVEFIHRYPEIERRISQSHIASYLGITPESLSRIRKQIAKSKSKS